MKVFFVLYLIIFINFSLNKYLGFYENLFQRNTNKKISKSLIQPILSDNVYFEGGIVTISQLDSFNILNTTAQFHSIQLRTDIFECETITILTYNSINCLIPKGFGTYLVVVKDNNVKSNPIYWSYKLGKSKKNQ